MLPRVFNSFELSVLKPKQPLPKRIHKNSFLETADRSCFFGGKMQLSLDNGNGKTKRIEQAEEAEG